MQDPICTSKDPLEGVHLTKMESSLRCQEGTTEFESWTPLRQKILFCLVPTSSKTRLFYHKCSFSSSNTFSVARLLSTKTPRCICADWMSYAKKTLCFQRMLWKLIISSRNKEYLQGKGFQEREYLSLGTFLPIVKNNLTCHWHVGSFSTNSISEFFTAQMKQLLALWWL